MSRSMMGRAAALARRALSAVRTVAARPGVHGDIVRSERKTIWKDDQNRILKTKSSWIRFFEYNQATQILKMYLLSGRVYSWEQISPSIAHKVLNGMAVCKTWDKSGRSRWVPNKTPSLGAGYWEFLAQLSGRQRRSDNEPRPIRSPSSRNTRRRRR